MNENNKLLRTRIEFFEEKSLPLGHLSDKIENRFSFKIHYMDENSIVLADNSGLWIIDRIEFKVIAY